MMPIIHIQDSWLDKMEQNGQASPGEVRAMAHELKKLRAKYKEDTSPAPLTDYIGWSFTP